MSASAPRIAWTKFFDATKGYGFLLDVETGKDVFVHFSALQCRERGWRGLYKGEYVNYRPSLNADGRSAAAEVTGVAGGPLMCEASAMTSPEFA
jgi:cold shock CspA family protein